MRIVLPYADPVGNMGSQTDPVQHALIAQNIRNCLFFYRLCGDVEGKRKFVEQNESNISVIICAYTQDRWNDLLAAIESVRNQTVPPKEIIVVSDHNPLLLKQLEEQMTGVVVVENVFTCGLSGARNSGLAVATGQIVAFLDDDAVAIPEWLATLLQGFSNPCVLGVGGASIPLWSQPCPVWFPKEFLWVVGCTYQGMPQCTTPVRNLHGSNMSFRREVFDVVGGFRSQIGRVGTYPVGCEETEFCIRIGQHWPESVVLYIPRATVYHRVPGKRLRWSYFCQRCYSEGISKAMVTQFVGVKSSLSTESTYILRTLLYSIMRNLGQALVDRSSHGLLRAGAIVVGLSTTMTGYVLKSMQAQSAKFK